MKKDYQISLYLDIRRKNKSGKYPVKLRVWSSLERKRKLFATKFEFEFEFEKDKKENELERILSARKLRGDAKNVQISLRSLEAKATEIAERLQPFDLESFEKLLFKGRTTKDISYFYDEAIAGYKAGNKFNTADNYKKSLKTLLEYYGKDTLPFSVVNKKFLNGYQNYMEETGRSLTTVGIYLRPLRAIFNTAIAAKELMPEQYPFGKKKFQITEPSKKKKSLTKEQLSVLWNADGTPYQNKARDFWFLSYCLNGMNIVDIAKLRYEELKGDIITFTREKTRNRKKSCEIDVVVNKYANAIIDKYGNPDKAPDNYIFDILKPGQTAEEQYRSVKVFVRFINQHLQSLCKNIEINEPVSCLWARHTFATRSVNTGASMELVSEALGHSNMKIIQNYFDGFSKEVKKTNSNNLMNF